MKKVTTLDRAAVVSRHVQLESIALKEAKLEATVDPLATPANVQADVQYRGRWEVPEQHPDHVFVEVDFRAVAHEADEGENGDDSQRVMLLEATYQVVYRLAEAADYPVDALYHFANLNGTYNAWPYWRELAQTVSGRVGMPAIFVPVFRPTARSLTDEELEQLSFDGELDGKAPGKKGGDDG